jgi:hypothetical protein
MNKIYQTPSLFVVKFKEDIVTTSTPGVVNFNPDWLSGTGGDDIAS